MTEGTDLQKEKEKREREKIEPEMPGENLVITHRMRQFVNETITYA